MSYLGRICLVFFLLLSVPMSASPLLARRCPQLSLATTGAFALREIDSSVVTTQQLTNPPRFVVDLSEVECVDTSSSAEALPPEVRRIRLGKHETFTRIFFDLSHEDTEGAFISQENEATVDFRRSDQSISDPSADSQELVTQLSFREIMRLGSKRRGEKRS
jgi:hypothetical protein